MDLVVQAGLVFVVEELVQKLAIRGPFPWLFEVLSEFELKLSIN